MTHPDVYLKAAQADLLIIHMIADAGLLEVVKHRTKATDRQSRKFQMISNFPAETIFTTFMHKKNKQCIVQLWNIPQ